MNDALALFNNNGKKRSKRMTSMGSRDLNELEAKLNEAFDILNSLGMTNDQLRKRFGKRSEVEVTKGHQAEKKSEEAEVDYEDDEDEPVVWSEYESWGLDKKRRKRGLGSIV